MSFMQPMVAAFRLVRKLIRPSTKQLQKFAHAIAHCTVGGVDHNVFALPRAHDKCQEDNFALQVATEIQSEPIRNGLLCHGDFDMYSRNTRC